MRNEHLIGPIAGIITDLWPHRMSTQAAERIVQLYMQDAVIDSLALEQWREFSERTFGPGRRTNGVIQHIKKELKEIEESPLDVEEWCDVMHLALDGARRAGASGQEIIDTLIAKQAKNEARDWPDWRTASEDAPIEHVR